MTGHIRRPSRHRMPHVAAESEAALETRPSLWQIHGVPGAGMRFGPCEEKRAGNLAVDMTQVEYPLA